ncbi:hypothetical protein MMMB2_3505 [Mycobacterium marinum MB2]|nr:hypothetical protein MMMB2_3505 [Mycobacterium marinum MB2]
MGGLGRFLAEHRLSAAGHPDPGRRALRTGVPALGGAQPATRGRPPIHALHESTPRRPHLAPTRRRRSLRPGRPGGAHPTLCTARTLRVGRRRGPLQP